MYIFPKINRPSLFSFPFTPQFHICAESCANPFSITCPIKVLDVCCV